MLSTIINKSQKVIKGLHFYSFGLLRRLYNWVLSWAYTKYGTLALSILAFVESSFFPIPPDVLQITLSVSRPKKSYWYALVSSFFSVLGGIFGYLIGLFLFDTIGQFIITKFHYEQYFNVVGTMYKNNALLAILAASFTPIPYKVFTIAAGFWDVDLMTLILASIIGRSGRFFLVGTLIYFFGPKIKYLLDKYFNWFTLIVFLLVIIGFLLIKYLT